MLSNGLGMDSQAALEAAEAAAPHVGNVYVGKLIQLRQEARSADDTLEQLQQEAILLERQYQKTLTAFNKYVPSSQKEHKSSSSVDVPRRASMGFHVMPAQLKVATEEAKKQAAQRERDREKHKGHREREHRHHGHSHYHGYHGYKHAASRHSPVDKHRRRTRSNSHSPKRHKKSKSPHLRPPSPIPSASPHRKRSKSRNSSKPGSTPPKRSRSPSKSPKLKPEKEKKKKSKSHLEPKQRRKPSSASRSPSLTRRAPRSSKKSSTHKPNSTKTSEKSERQPEYETIEYDDLKFDKNIGKGSFGTVSLGTWQGENVAIKQICVKDSETFEELENEIKIMTHLNSNCICRVYGSSVKLYGVAKQSTGAESTQEDAYYLVMELCETSLYDFIKNSMKTSNMMGTRLRICQQIATGLKHLHSAGIIHRDMKTANVLLKRVNSGQPQVKISDFGLSMRAQQPDDDCLCGTPGYMAPELYNDKNRKYNELTDIFALGMVYQAIFSGHSPFHRMEAAEKEEAIKGGKRPSHLDWMSDQISRLIAECWDHEPTSRPTAEQVEKDLETMQPENLFKYVVKDLVKVYSKSQQTWFEDGQIEDVCMLYFDEKPVGSACVSYDMTHPQGKLRKWVRPDRFSRTIRRRDPLPAELEPGHEP